MGMHLATLKDSMKGSDDSCAEDEITGRRMAMNQRVETRLSQQKRSDKRVTRRHMTEI
jgi:hypothetical protein